MSAYNLTYHREQVEEAERALAAARPGLGVYHEEERRRRLAALEGAVQAAAQKAQATADAALRDAEAALAPPDDLVLLDGLDRGDLAEAAHRDPFVRQDFEQLAPARLAARIAAVAARGEPVTRLLYLRHGRRWVAAHGGDEAISAHLRRLYGRGEGEPATPLVDTAPVAAALGALEATFHDRAQRAAAERQRAEAEELSAVVGERRMHAYLREQSRWMEERPLPGMRVLPPGSAA